MKQLLVLYFGSLRAARGVGEETVTTEAATPAGIYRELADRHGFKLPAERILFALNDDYIAADAPLPQKGVLALMPPLAGG